MAMLCCFGDIVMIRHALREMTGPHVLKYSWSDLRTCIAFASRCGKSAADHANARAWSCAPTCLHFQPMQVHIYRLL